MKKENFKEYSNGARKHSIGYKFKTTFLYDEKLYNAKKHILFKTMKENEFTQINVEKNIDKKLANFYKDAHKNDVILVEPAKKSIFTSFINYYH